MNDSWPDLTAKIDPVHARALGVVADAAAQVGVDWFLVGALARDWLLEALHGVPTQRKTSDADIAIALPDWPAWNAVTRCRCASIRRCSYHLRKPSARMPSATDFMASPGPVRVPARWPPCRLQALPPLRADSAST